MSEARTVGRRAILGRMGGVGLASAFAIAGKSAAAQTTGGGFDASIVFKATVASGEWCGRNFVARADYSTDDSGMIESGVLVIAEMSGDLPFLEADVEYPLVGQSVDRTLDFRVAVDGGRFLTLHGVMQQPRGAEEVEVAGTFGGPVGCLMGTWSTTIMDDSEWCDDCGCNVVPVAPVASSPTVPSPEVTTPCPTEPTEPTEPTAPTEPTEPATEPTEPTTVATEPTTVATEPTTVATEPTEPTTTIPTIPDPEEPPPITTVPDPEEPTLPIPTTPDDVEPPPPTPTTMVIRPTRPTQTTARPTPAPTEPPDTALTEPPAT